MSAREHSRFVHFLLPWMVAAAGFVLYVVTLNRWVSLDGIEVVAKVAGWDWNTMQLGPVTLLLTWPFRWLPATWQPLALNAFSALLAGVVLGLLAKCVALLPHDRTREQRQRERSDFSFLTVRTAWIPPVTAAALLAFQLTFWEHATAMTGEMVNLLLFAFCIFCFLRFRVNEEDGYLALLSFTFGAAAANDWGVVAFCPLFFVAIVWVKGIRFFEAKFLITTTAAGLLGTLFYFVQPLALKITGQAEGSFIELLRTQLGFQRQLIFSFPRWALLFCGVGSVLPIFFMGIRWPSTFGDLSAAGAAMSNFLSRLIHTGFLVFCLWTMFDPPFSPRQLGFGLPFLHFYFLTALSIGYFSGYLLLIFGQEPDRKLKRASDGMQALGRAVAALAGASVLAAAVVLARYNWPALRGQNGTLVRDMASEFVDLPPGNTVLLSDDNNLLMLAMGLLAEQGRSPEAIPINTQYLRRHVYQSHHELRYGTRWPALAIERLSDPLGDDILLRQMVALSYTNQLFYLHPSFGYYFEPFHLVPTNGLYALTFQPTNTYVLPPLTEEQFEAVNRHWTHARESLVDTPLLPRMLKQRVPVAKPVGGHYARAFDAWGVELQRRQRLVEAEQFFSAAKELNPENLAAIINHRFNENLRAGRRESVKLTDELTDALGKYRDLPTFLSLCGPVDEPSFCFNLGKIFSDGNLHRQAAQQFARTIELQPDSVEMRLWLANAALSAGMPAEVLKTIQALRDLGRDLTPAQAADLVGLEAWAVFREDRLPDAERLLEEAQRQMPDRPELIQTLADIYVAANQTNAALATIDKLIEKNPSDARTLITRSAILMQSGALNEAVQTLTAVLAKDPGFFPALVNRSLALVQLGRLDEAEKDYLKLLELAPKMTSVYYHLGEIDFQRRKAVEARRHYRRFLEGATPGSPEAHTAQQRLDDIAAGKLGR